MSGIANLFISNELKKRREQDNRIKQIQSVASQINQLQNVAKEIESSSGWKSRPRGAWENVKQWVGENPELDEYEGLRNMLSSQVSRKLAGEKGAGTEGDIQRAVGLLPDVWDSTEARQRKFSRIQEIMNALMAAEGGNQ